MYIRNQIEISSLLLRVRISQIFGPLDLQQVPPRTCLGLQFEDPEEAVVPSTGNEALVFVPGDTLQMYIVRDRDLCRQRRQRISYCLCSMQWRCLRRRRHSPSCWDRWTWRVVGMQTPRSDVGRSVRMSILLLDELFRCIIIMRRTLSKLN